jgi:uncharacterized membrane protein YfcA
VTRTKRTLSLSALSANFFSSALNGSFGLGGGPGSDPTMISTQSATTIPVSVHAIHVNV